MSSHITRDGEGRTRRDQTLDVIGPWVTSANPPEMSFIMDPVAKVHYILEHEKRTARQLPLLNMVERPNLKVVRGPDPGMFELPLPPPPPGGPESAVFVAGTRVMNAPDARYETRTESLGKRTIEGVEAQGTRSVTTIPAGAIGNERPIDIISESWYAPSLQLVVLSQNSDPRFGQTTYRLENLSLIDPLPSLFEVPRDYTVVAAPEQPAVRREFRRPVAPVR
jgi:hypothetical protein